MGKRNGAIFEIRTGGIVLAVTCAIAIAFTAITVLFLMQNAQSAVTYTEDEASRYGSEVTSELTSFVYEESSLVKSGLLDPELEGILASGALRPSADHATSRELFSLLGELVVDAGSSWAFVASPKTHQAFFSDSSVSALDRPDQVDWLDKACGNERLRKSGAMQTTCLSLREDGQDAVSAWRVIGKGDDAVVLGTSLKAASLRNEIARCSVEHDQGAVYFDKEGRVLFGYDDRLSVGTNVFDVFPQLAERQPELSRGMPDSVRVWIGLEGLFPHGQMLLSASYLNGMDCFLLTINTGQAIFDEARSSSIMLLFALGVVMALLILLTITGVRWYRIRLMKAAATDELTGLANRKSFVSHYGRFVGNEMLGEAALALVDVDYFKQINDNYGHAGGDRALVAIADEVREAAGSDGICGRWGGDEFILATTGGPEEVRDRLQRMIERVASREIEGGIKASVSVGLAQIDKSFSLERMVERADDALYVTKEGGRGFLTVYDPETTPHMSASDNEARRDEAAPQVARASVVVEDVSGQGQEAASTGAQRGKVWTLVVKSLLDAVRKMVPFVAGGGILIAAAFLIDAASVDISALSTDARANFGSITPIAAGLHELGAAAFNFMLPIFAAFFARGLAGDHAFMAGFAGGFLASQGSSGFLGAIFAAVVAALVVRLMSNFLDETVPLIRRIAPVLLYPVFSLIIMYLFMVFLINPFATAFDAVLTSFLEFLREGNRVVLGAVSGAMMATDMGGPVNKAAYHFGVAAIDAGAYDIMAAVMVGGMVPPCGIAICMLLFRDCFNEADFDLGPSTFVMGLSFITEGAIPFVLADILRVIPSCMVGSALAGGLSMAFGCTLMAPHGGIFVFPVVGQPVLYVVALLAGSLLTALVLGFLKRYARRAA